MDTILLVLLVLWIWLVLVELRLWMIKREVGRLGNQVDILARILRRKCDQVNALDRILHGRGASITDHQRDNADFDMLDAFQSRKGDV